MDITLELSPRYGIGIRAMELAFEISPTSLFFGAQPGKNSLRLRFGQIDAILQLTFRTLDA